MSIVYAFRRRSTRLRLEDVRAYDSLRKEVKAKITRLRIFFNIEAAYMISIPDIEEIKTRRQFNTWRKEANEFLGLTLEDIMSMKRGQAR